MDLWIRNQSKLGLYKIDGIYIDDRNFGNEDIQYYIMTSCIVLGKYKTKERALQILDEIHNILQPRIIVHEPEINYDDIIQSLSENVVIQANQKMDMELKQAGQVVYQMPEE